MIQNVPKDHGECRRLRATIDADDHTTQQSSAGGVFSSLKAYQTRGKRTVTALATKRFREQSATHRGGIKVGTLPLLLSPLFFTSTSPFRIPSRIPHILCSARFHHSLWSSAFGTVALVSLNRWLVQQHLADSTPQPSHHQLSTISFIPSLTSQAPCLFLTTLLLSGTPLPLRAVGSSSIRPSRFSRLIPTRPR